MTKAEVLKVLETVDDDEPLFLLRADDPDAESTVLWWAHQNLVRNASRLTTDKKVSDDNYDARRLAVDMAEWRFKKLTALWRCPKTPQSPPPAP